MTPRLLLALLALAVLWGSAFPVIKVGLEGLSPGHLTLLRHFVASACYLPFLLLARTPLRPARRDWGMVALLGLLGFFIYHTALNYGEQQVSAGAASLIIATAPAFTAIIAALFLHDRLPGAGWLGIGLSFAGVVLIVLGDEARLSFNPYALLILLSAIVTAFYSVLQKPLYRRYSAVQLTAYSTWAGTLPMFIFLPGFLKDLSDAGTEAVLAGVYIGVVPSAIAYALFAYAISRTQVTLVAAFLYVVPVFSLLFSWLLLGETPSMLTLLGGFVAIVGVALVHRNRRKVQRQTSATPLLRGR